jgi:hypothetical protein
VTVAPEDTLCVNNVQDSPGLGQDYVCRSVRVVAPSDGIMTLEAVSTQGGAHPPLEVEAVGVSPCCSERMGNPTSIQVTAGTEIVVNVEMVLGSTTSQSFTLNTAMARPRVRRSRGCVVLLLISGSACGSILSFDTEAGARESRMRFPAVIGLAKHWSAGVRRPRRQPTHPAKRDQHIRT